MTLEDRVKPHCELESFHYQALKNPEYQMEGMMSCLREEMMMSTPHYREEETALSVQKPQELIIPKGTLYAQVRYLRGLTIYLQNKLNEHIDKKDGGYLVDR